MSYMHYGDPEERKRKDEFAKDQNYEYFMERLNKFLLPLEDEMLRDCKAPKLPVTFIVGAPRCGGTVLMQLAVNTFALGYPSNLLARFFMAPSIGAWLQSLILNRAPSRTKGFNSSYGETFFPEEPHEFGYFWTSHFPVESIHYFTPQQLANIDKSRLLKELASMEKILSKPLIFKSLNLDFLITFLVNCIPTPFFIYVRRDPYFLAESIYLARIARYGTPDAWWSLRPKQYMALKKLDNYRQVAGQVWAIKTEIERQLKKVSGSNKMIINYEDLCRDPEGELSRYCEKISFLDLPLERIGPLLKPLEGSNTVKLDNDESQRLRVALEEMETEKMW